MIAMLIGWLLMLMGVIFFFAGGGAALITAILSSRLSAAPLGPGFPFSMVGLGLWLLGAVMMLAGWIAGRKAKDQRQK